MVNTNLGRENDDEQLDSGIGVDNFPEEVRKKKTKRELDIDSVDEFSKKLFNPKKKDDPFDRSNWNV